jgi:hypothetical protein
LAYQSRLAWRWSRTRLALLRPAFNVGQGLIHEVLHIRVSHVRFSSKTALAAAFLCKVWPSRIRHPNLHRAKPCHAQGVAVLLNPCIYMCVCHMKHPLARYMQQYSRILRYMQQSVAEFSGISAYYPGEGIFRRFRPICANVGMLVAG